ncbi:MAG: isoleucine--tRNA ligase [Kiritimatiellae bacterium]|nr:isoleucine--tRNA ligase [Kiritimatiellia bacterium]
MGSRFREVSNRADFGAGEEDVLAFWEEAGIFEKSLESRRGGKEYVFYDGPPFATGLPHYGHLLAGTIKDIIPRYQTMRGHYVARRFGWDCHGLPIEALAQEALGLAGTAAIHEAGIDVFNEQCRSMVQTYVGEWRKIVTRMGRWVDFDNDYKTMDTSFMETIWWVFRQLWDQGRIYRSHRIMPYSWKLTTPLSNFEAGSNYKDVQDPAITVRVKLVSADPELPAGKPVYALLWTTTPWTLPGNLAVCAGPDIEYVAVEDVSDGDVYVMARERVGSIYKKEDQFRVVKTYTGKDLYGWTYEPLFPYFADQPNAFRILNDPFVTTEDGTGLVHIAPAYGEDDFRVSRDEGIELVDPLDADCAFTAQVPEYQGQFVKDADKAIIRRLKDEGKLIHQSTIVHSYPFCERTDTPLVYRAIDAWYVRVEDMRDDLVANNDTIHWVPDYVGDRRFGNWLKEAKDWNISRNRYWGSCLPIWINEDDREDMICVGSVDELEELSGVRVDDLHKHIVDQVVIEKDGKTYRRTPEVLDCWFESGAMPLAQQHYPFERGGQLDDFFPADFIAEGLDQTRGWFYTLLVLSTALFGKSCYRNVIVNGLVLAEDGRKMSKRLKNYPDPSELIHAYGADAIRLYMIYSPVVRAEDLRFSEDGVKHLMRNIMIPLWNAYSFFVTYATIDGWTPEEDTSTPGSNVLDRWIRSSMASLIERVTGAMDVYDLQRSIRPFVHFIEDLTNWYIRRSRRRFWKSQDDADKAEAYRTLYEVLLQWTRVAAPFVPFISETIYRNLRTADMPESVHLCDFPGADDAARDEELEAEMDLVMTVVRLGRVLRTDHNLKVRQPLSVLHVVSRNRETLDRINVLADLVRDELNVKQVELTDMESELVLLKAKADFKALGPRFGKQVKQVAGAIAGLPEADLETLANGDVVTMDLDGEFVEIGPADVVIERIPREGVVVASEGELVVALETALTPDLVAEGLAREEVNKVQNLRKGMGLDVSQRIKIEYDPAELDADVRDAREQHRDYINAETLCLGATYVDATDGEGWETVDLNGHAARLRIVPVNGA